MSPWMYGRPIVDFIPSRMNKKVGKIYFGCSDSAAPLQKNRNFVKIYKA